MKKKLLISFLAIGILFSTASFKNDFFEIAKQIEIFTTLFKELNMNYVDETTPAILMDKARQMIQRAENVMMDLILRAVLKLPADALLNNVHFSDLIPVPMTKNTNGRRTAVNKRIIIETVFAVIQSAVSIMVDVTKAHIRIFVDIANCTSFLICNGYSIRGAA